MTVSISQVGRFMRISGTIAEVLQGLSDQKASKATQIVYYSDDGTAAKAIVGRIA